MRLNIPAATILVMQISPEMAKSCKKMPQKRPDQEGLQEIAV